MDPLDDPKQIAHVKTAVFRVGHGRATDQWLGATDGDRAACLAISMGIEPVRLHLIGHRSDIVGRWTGPTDPIRKLQKLEWMSRIFEMLGVKMDAIPPEAKGRGGE